MKPDKPTSYESDFEKKLHQLENDSQSKLPDLHNTYDQIFDNIPADEEYAREHTTRALKWTLWSQRPLTVSELAHAVAMQDGGSTGLVK